MALVGLGCAECLPSGASLRWEDEETSTENFSSDIACKLLVAFWFIESWIIWRGEENAIILFKRLSHTWNITKTQEALNTTLHLLTLLEAASSNMLETLFRQGIIFQFIPTHTSFLNKDCDVDSTFSNGQTTPWLFMYFFLLCHDGSRYHDSLPWHCLWTGPTGQAEVL